LFDDLVVAVDVQNPLLGPTGCSRIYGPQKGLSEFDFAERCLGQLVRVLEQELHIHHASEPGAGAAGGLGFGLRSFANARLEAGFDRFAKVAGLEERLKKAQVVITGEGAVDASTLMGKGVGEVAGLCRRLDVPCIGLAGILNDAEIVRTKLSAAHALTPEFTTPDQAMRDAALWLERLAAKVATDWNG
jgi:glycerate kinase